MASAQVGFGADTATRTITVSSMGDSVLAASPLTRRILVSAALAGTAVHRELAEC